MYSLLIRRYNTSERFDTLEELKKEVSRHFTRSEGHIVEKLTTFPLSMFDKNGLCIKNYQDYSTTCYHSL